MQNLFVFFLVYFISFFGLNTNSSSITHCGVYNPGTIQNKVFVQNSNIMTDTTLTYSSPTIQLNPEGETMLFWSEKSTDGLNALCFAVSADNGASFTNKKVIAQNTGLGNSRFAKAKLLFRKNGDWVVVYSQRFENPLVGKPGGRGPAGIVFSTSADKGNTWSTPVFVDTDPNKKLLRGFFDAAIMPNDELAVAYLKDVAGSTKHEERNLRLVVTEKMQPKAEQIIDEIACDCCPVNVSITAKGELQVMYRDNNNDIRDMAILSSKDNGKTFAASRILSADNWKIAGCPHSGAVTLQEDKAALWAWQAGSEKEPGLRVVDAKGKKLFINSDASAKNPAIAGNAKMQVVAWEQNKDNVSKIAYKIMQNGSLKETTWLPNSENGMGASVLVAGNMLIMAYEVKMPNKKNQMKVEVLSM